MLNMSVKVWCQAGSDRDPVALCVRLRDVLGSVREFVSAHPTELVAVHVTSGEGGGDWRASVDWKTCKSVVLEILRDKLVLEHMREMPLGNCSAMQCRRLSRDTTESHWTVHTSLSEGHLQGLPSVL